MDNHLHFGCMGFSYKEWVGPFYKPGTAPGEMLPEYARCFNSVELDTTFYAPPRESSVKKWLDDTPPGFSFAAKLWQRITHEKAFVDVADDLGIFMQAIERLGDKLGPLLIQCPPDLTVGALPAFSAFAAGLPGGFRWAVEFRHRSWFTPEVKELLQSRNISVVGADLYYMPKFLVRTGDFAYVRLLGNRKKVVSIGKVVEDRTEDVARWAEEITSTMPDAEEAWIFANNHYSGFSPDTIGMLMRDLGLEKPVFPAEEPQEQPSLF